MSMNTKNNFNNSTSVEIRKEIELSENRIPSPKANIEAFDVYTTSNVRVRKDFREKIYTLKGRTGNTLQVIYDKIFAEYFKNNPL